MANKTFKLNTGSRIRSIGLGTWQSPEGQVRAAVAHAIQCGYRHIDCAYTYGNEQEVGEGMKQALSATGLRREDLFIITKLWCTYHTRVAQNLNISLNLLGLDYVDLYLMHWPVAMNPDGIDEKSPKVPDGSRDLLLSRSHFDTYKDMQKLLKVGKTRAIGVCNYSKNYLEELLPHIDTVPTVNQIETIHCSPNRTLLTIATSTVYTLPRTAHWAVQVLR